MLMLTIDILIMVVTNVFNKFRKSLLYIGYSKDKMSFYNFQNAFVSSRNMAYLLNMLSSYSNCIKVDDYITIMGNEFNFNEFIVANTNNENVKFEIQQDEFKNYKVLFFRKPVEGSNVISQLHIFNDELLYARVSFDYLLVGDHYRESILSEISKKYNLNIELLKEKNVVIQDPNNSRLKIIDNGKIILQYASGNRNLLRKFFYEASLERDQVLEAVQRQSVIASFI